MLPIINIEGREITVKNVIKASENKTKHINTHKSG